MGAEIDIYETRSTALVLPRCSTAFVFTGARVEPAPAGKLAVRHEDCGALNELASNGMSEAGYELWKVIGEVRPVH